MHGVGVDVPASWPRNDERCGRPQHDTLVVQPTNYTVEDCDTRPVPGLSVVRLGGWDADPHVRHQIVGDANLGSRGLARLRHDVVDGAPALVGTASGYAGVDERVHIVVFPQRRAFVTARSTDPGVVRSVLASIQVVRRDPASGCAVHTSRYDKASALPHQPGNRLLPAMRPASVTACDYINDWLEQTATVTGPAIARLAALLRSAPRPTNAKAPRDWPGCVWVDQEFHQDREPMAMFFHYAGSSTRLVVARIVPCTRWQSYVTDGTVTRRITGPMLRAFPRAWQVFPDPGSMRVHRR